MSEKRLAKKDGARLVSNSGRGVQKGDAILDGVFPFLVDYKEYTSSFTISHKNWEKHSDDAWEQGQRSPVIALVLDSTLRLAIVDWETFLWFRKCAEFVDRNNINMKDGQWD